MHESRDSMHTDRKLVLAGFWRRLFADILDVLFLGAAGFALSVPLDSLFWRLGAFGAWIGLLVTFLYSGLLQASLGQGQTIGKRILGIQVLRLDGSYLSVPQSLLRYAILAVVSYGSCIIAAIGTFAPSLAASDTLRVAMTMLAIASFLGCSVMIILHPQKRGLHDLLSGSIVVRKGTYDQQELMQLADPRREVRALVAVVVPVMLCLAVGVWLLRDSNPQEGQSELEAVQKELRQVAGVSCCKFTFHLSPAGAALEVKLGVDRSLIDDKQAASQKLREVSEILLRQVHDLSDFNYVQVTLVASYNLGFYSNQVVTFTRFDSPKKLP